MITYEIGYTLIDMSIQPDFGSQIKIGDKVEKIKGYPFRGTVIGIGTKSDGKHLLMVEIEPGPNAAGLVYLHPFEVLKKVVDLKSGISQEAGGVRSRDGLSR